MSHDPNGRTTCRACNGTGVGGGQWRRDENGSAEFEPFRCSVCEGAGIDQVDEQGISHGMITTMLEVVSEGLRTGSTDMRSLLYCAYREARKLEVKQLGPDEAGREP